MCLALALLMTVACFAACGGGDETTAPPITGTEGESGRNAVKDTVPTNLKFDGEKVVFFVSDSTEMKKNEMDVDKTTNNTLYDAVYYRNTAVEQRLGVTIEQIGQPGTLGYYDSWNSTLRNAVLTKTGDYDSAAIHSSQGSVMAIEGIYYNILDIPYINFEKPWWNKSIHEELTVFNTLYYLAGDICATETQYGVCLFFNKDLFSEFYTTQNINLYSMVEEQKWTVDEMYKLVSDAWIDENSDGVVSLGDVFGFLANNAASNDAWVPAMGISITKMVDGCPVLTFYDEHTVEAFEKVKKLYLDNPGSLVVNNYDGANSEFIAGDQLFVRAKFVDAESFRNMQNKYGVLPLPKFDEAQDDYHTTFHNSASLVVVLSTCTELEKVGATLELMAAEAYKQVTPAYFEVCLQGKYSNSPDDAAMYDRIISSFKYDFGMCYSTKSIGGVGALFRDLNKDLAHTYSSNKDKYETALDTLVDKLDEISFIAG